MQSRELPITMADGQVNILAREIDMMERSTYSQIDVGMSFGEAVEAVNEPLGREIGELLTVSAPAF